jgi:signal transduction histidine kinase
MNMLAFSKTRLPNLKPEQLNKIVSDAITLAQTRAGERNVELLTELEDQLPPIPIDSQGIHQVALNIISNAVDAVEPGEGVVHISTVFDSEAGIADFIVSDNGPGIEQEKIEELFEPFKSSKGQGGTGLGLAVARKLVREHHGRIVVESKPGEGTTFRIRLPAQEMAQWSEETYSALQ